MSHISGGRWSKSIYAREPLRTAETRLWRGVLEQAYADAELSLEVECDDDLCSVQIRARRFRRADTPGEKPGSRLVCGYDGVSIELALTGSTKHYTPSPAHSERVIE